MPDPVLPSLEPQRCWACNEVVDSYTDAAPGSTTPIGEGQPVPGAVCICAYCALPGIVTDEGTQRKPTNEEMEEILSDPRVRRIILFVAMNPAKKGPKRGPQ